MIRIGFGTDLHRLVPGSGIALGGIIIPCEYAAEADSDGDVLLHALTDALLGSLALGDIGQHFPKHAVAPGAASHQFVAYAMDLLHKQNASVVNIDGTIDLESPKIGPYRDAMRTAIAEITQIPVDRISIKAKTCERLGPIGEHLALSAQVAVLVETNDSLSA